MQKKTVVWRPLKIAQDARHGRQMGLPSVESARLPEQLLLLQGLHRRHAPLRGLRPALSRSKKAGSWSDGRSATSDDDDRSSCINRSDGIVEPLDDDSRCHSVRCSQRICGRSKRWRNPAMHPWCTGLSSASTTSSALATILLVCCFACCDLGAGGAVLV
jgi:hypothetical protein